MLGQRCRPLKANNTYGTGCFVLLHTGKGSSASQAGLDRQVKVLMAPGMCVLSGLLAG